MQDRRVALFEIGLHQVDAGQVFICRADALEGFAGDVHEHRKTCAGADKHSLKAHLKQLVDGQNLADDHVGHDLDALCLQFFDLIGDNSLRQTELRNAVDQNAAGSVQRLKQGHRIALLGKQRRAGQAGRAGADDSDLDAVGLSLFRHGVDVLAIPVGDKALQTPDRDWLALVAADALGFALRLLRTDTAGKGGQRIGIGDDLIGLFEVALGDLMDKFGNMDIDRAALDTVRLLALQAALGLINGHLSGITQRDFLEILIADVRVLLRHRSLGSLHISHDDSLPLLDELFAHLLDAADMGLALFCFSLAVDAVAAHELVIIDLVAVKIRAVDTGELHLAADRDAAHTGSVDHDRVQRNDGLDAERLGRLGDKLHHRDRADGEDLVILNAGLEQLLQLDGHETVFAVGAVVGHEIQMVTGLLELVFENDDVLVTEANDHIGFDASLFKRLCGRIRDCTADTAADNAHALFALYIRRLAERADEVLNVIALVQAAEHFGRQADLLEDDRNRSLFAVIARDRQRNAL